MIQAATKPLVVFDMANNHMGRVEHGIRILRAFGAAVEPFRERFDFAFKLQYRDLDTFIHPDFRHRTDLKYVKRFLETRLTEEQFLSLKDEMLAEGFLPVCTPFDERSVDRVEAHGFQILKIASCSLGDWPLMERIGCSTLPIIASTGGASVEVLDQVVSFFDHRRCSLTLLHCIGEYPTQAAHLQLNQIAFLKARYPHHAVGFSTHENGDNTRFVQMAVAEGAAVLEKHVGLPADGAPLNAYSASPEQVVPWLEAAAEAMEACGSSAGRYTPQKDELDSLHALRRGVYVTNEVASGKQLEFSNLLLAIPAEPGQLTANDLSKFADFRVHETVPAKGPVFTANLERTDHRHKVLEIVLRVRALLQASHAVVSEKAEVEISHHYGLERFDEIGTTIINVVNRAYCKKLIVMLPRQRHPEQYHKQKEETFHILHGQLHVRLNDVETTVGPGAVMTVERGVRHEFWSETGAIIEEISSTHYKDDSFYTDPTIQKNVHRKTELTYFFR